ncbi:3-isopropylmalate dehydratase large subunit [Enterovibrio norvegicus]|uniref:3-isopropylmalate dehydratase large subunit n=1 Tax=Enterovibrio norvegicus TaxID=188144 RepID=UPI000C8564BD|nr:3-isopropylmalate dehydratase large subunit [Enterovibrio norvegicus]PMN68564.1 3-isopropylmalate dehydratase large subunit [Enterovibrio norvegicus]
MNKTLYDKLVDAHTVCELPDGDLLVYVDFHIMNEYTSPQAFSGLATKHIGVRKPEAHLAVVDHVNATKSREHHDEASKLLIENLEKNCKDHDIAFYGLGDPRQGIEHIVVPEQGLVAPGMLIACGDSHTTTYGAYGALGFGIGTSEVEHVLATQTLRYKRLKTMRVDIDGETQPGVTGKDIIMHVVKVIGAGGANGYAVEFSGAAIRDLEMAGRMTVCNMAVELGARAALIAADEKSYEAANGKPQGANLKYDSEEWSSDCGAEFDKYVTIDASDISPLVTWGTSPDQSVSVSGTVPTEDDMPTPKAKAGLKRALEYMGLTPGQKVSDIEINTAFIGSCTNSRIEDLRSAAAVVKGRKVAKGVEAIVIPGSALTRFNAETEGLDKIFIDAGFDWRPESGCSMCLAMNNDIARDGERIASSTNRNFEGRQGRGARTHLMDPALVAASAIAGRLVDVKTLEEMGE